MRVQTAATPFAFGHPLVYAIRSQDRVEALDKFIHDELNPKLSRLREEHKSIEHQIQRTNTKPNDSVGTSRETKAKRLKKQAWLWKRTSKRHELNRFEPFVDLATDLRKLSKELNPNLLRLTVMWQRSQSIAPRKHLVADDSNDVVYNQTVIGEKRDRGRQREQQRLSRDYYNALLENAILSKSIQKQTDKLKTSKAPNSNSMEDASILSSLMIFSYQYIACGTCETKFHKDYINALVVRIPSHGKIKSCDSTTNSEYMCIHCWNSKSQVRPNKQKLEVPGMKPLPSTNNLSQWPNDNNNFQEKENLVLATPSPQTLSKKNPMQENERWKARKLVIKNRLTAVTTTSNCGSSNAEIPDSSKKTINKPSVISAASTVSSTDFTIGPTPSCHSSSHGDTSCSTKKNITKASTTGNSKDAIAFPSVNETIGSISSNPKFSCVETRSSIDSNVDQDDAKSEISKASAAVDHYIDSMSILDDGLIRIGESLSSCSNLILGESNKQSNLGYNLPPLLQPLSLSNNSKRPRNIDIDRVQTKSPSVANSNNNQIETDTSERSDAWSRCGSSVSSLCTNSIVESDPEDSSHSRNTTDSNTVRYKMDDSSQGGKTPLKRSNSWNLYGISSDSSACSSSIFSELSTETSKFSYLSASSSERLRPKYIKSAMKKTGKASKPSSTKGASPTKVQDFPSPPLHKSVRFQSPLEECRVFDPIADSHSGKALLDTSAEIIEQVEYFCKWDTFMNAFDQKSL